MTFTHALATNNYGPSKFIVATNPANGTHTTLASALTAASSGDTIFLRDSVTENVTAKAGVDILSYDTAGGTPAVSIIGTITATFAGTCTISGIRLTTNSAAVLAITGSNATIVNLNNCYINATNATPITINNSNATVNLYSCNGDLGTTGIAIFDVTACNNLNFEHSYFNNTADSTTASTIAAGNLRRWWTRFASGISVTGTAEITDRWSRIEASTLNITSLTLNTSDTGSNSFYCAYSSGTATAIVLTAGTLKLAFASLDTSNAASISGAGTLEYGDLSFRTTGGATNAITVTTQTPYISRPGIWRSEHQPCFSAFNNNVSQNNITGNGTKATINFTNEIYDIGGGYNGTNTYTAPYAGKYFFSCAVQMEELTNGTTSQWEITTSNRQIRYNNVSASAVRTSTGNLGLGGSVSTDMDLGDTCVISVTVNNIGADTADASATTVGTWFNGFLLC